MTTSRALILLSIFVVASAQASELTENFSSRANLVSGTAVWNHALGKVHSNFQVVSDPGNPANPFPTTPVSVDVGDGSHGVFDITTYASFSVGGNISGNIIRFDTTTYPILKVTSFHLASGWTIEPVGSNPLKIYSLSDIRIEGTISCEGTSGGDPLGAIPGAGGLGRCGGANGGMGGTAAAEAGDGSTPDAAIGGGQGGHPLGSGVSGGGGGSWNTSSPALASANATGAGGNLGMSSSDPEFTNFFGGAGGGGGASSGGNAGGGGGGGGGTVVLHAVGDISIGQQASPTTPGQILVHGGIGGSAATAAGAGGGGGGGSVQAFSGGAINFFYDVFPLEPASDAEPREGGNDGTAKEGGLGAGGRNWFAAVTYNPIGTGYTAPAEDIPALATDPGHSEFVTTTQTVISRVFDLESSLPEISALTLAPVSTDFLLEASGSSDNFVSDDTGWTANLVSLRNKRYLKYRISITTSNTATPDMVDSLSITYSATNREEFNFQAAGCGRIEDGTPVSLWPLAIAFLIFISMRITGVKKYLWRHRY